MKLSTGLAWSYLCFVLLSAPAWAEFIVAEGEAFKPTDSKGWQVIAQNDSYASHTYGGMWVTHGACLGAPAKSVGSVASQTITVKTAGQYRVWSKYQAPPYFNYVHKLEIKQAGKTLFAHEFGKKGTPRLWSFWAASDELWWPWGVDHDCAEAPKTPVNLAAGPAELLLHTVANPEPAGDRCLDFIILTTNLADEYEGLKERKVGSPFANEALSVSKLYLRFQNSGKAPAKLDLVRAVGHFQPQYGGARTSLPEQPALPGQWSNWHNIGPFCRLVHDDGLQAHLKDAPPFRVQIARDEAGKELVGDFEIATGETFVVPLDITWRKDAKVQPSKILAQELIAKSKTWRTANQGKKPREILFYGAFGKEDYSSKLKDALGYNTLLPDGYEQVARAGLHAHTHNQAEIRNYVKSLTNKEKLRILSFGDEIHLGQINFADKTLQEKFRAWLKAKNVTPTQLGMPVEQAVLTKTGNSRLVWYSNLFNEEERFGHYREMTQLAKELVGPHVLTGANYSPHTLALCYGPIYQWVDIFKHKGMTMFWGEDYVFSVPEVPQILSWMLAEIHCGTKYHQLPIHMYLMPHAPGQEASFLRRNTLLSVGYGTAHIDSFWVAPAENFTENYVGWGAHDTFKVIRESIYDAAEVEGVQQGAKLRPARVAVVLSKATDFNESRLMVPREQDPFAGQCQNAPKEVNQIICRKEQQMLYLALKHAQHQVELITEDDIAEGILKKFEVVYFAGEWIDDRAVKALQTWVEAGGVLYAAGGAGQKDQFGETNQAMHKLLGLKETKLSKNVAILRTLLELPLLQPIDTITFAGKPIPVVGMKQQLVPDQAKVLGTWKDGTAAVTLHTLGKGKAYTVGTLMGNSWMKTALKPVPWARGGKKMLYNPVNFDASATALVQLGLSAQVQQDVLCSVPGIEAVLLDHSSKGSLLTLVNWTNSPAEQVKVEVRLPRNPKQVRSVTQQKVLAHTYEAGKLSFTLNLAEGDFVLLVP